MDLIEFATAALYTSEGQPMRAHTFHRLLLLLHPASTTARLVCPQQDRRIDVSASSYTENIARKTRRRHFKVNSLKTKVPDFVIDPFFTSAQNSVFIV